MSSPTRTHEVQKPSIWLRVELSNTRALASVCLRAAHAPSTIKTRINPRKLLPEIYAYEQIGDIRHSMSPYGTLHAQIGSHFWRPGNRDANPDVIVNKGKRFASQSEAKC